MDRKKKQQLNHSIDTKASLLQNEESNGYTNQEQSNNQAPGDSWV